MLRIGVVMEIFLYIYNFRHFFFGHFSAIYSFDSIFVSFHPNNMIFGTFWREFKVLPKTGPFAVFLFRKWKTRTTSPVFSSLFPVRSQSWIGLKTGLTNTIGCLLWGTFYLFWQQRLPLVFLHKDLFYFVETSSSLSWKRY